MRAYLFALIPMSFLGGVQPRAEAATLRIDFSGTVWSVTDGVSGTIPGRAPVSGTVVLANSGAEDITPSPTQGAYQNLIASFELRIGEYTTTSAGLGQGNIIVVHEGEPSSDLFYARAPMSGASVNGFSLNSAQFGLVGSPNTSAFDGDGIPTPEELLNFPQTQRYLNFLTSDSVAGSQQRVDWEVTSFSVVPEPTAYHLVALGLLFIGIRARHQR